MDANAYFELFKGRKLPFVIDDSQYRGVLEQRGFQVVHFDDHDFQRPEQDPLFFLITRLEYHGRLMKLWEHSKFISSHLALAKFDASPRGIEYSLSQLLSVDFFDTLARRGKFYDDLLSCDEVDVVSPHGVLCCRFGGAVEVANNDVEMEPGWMYSVAEFFESSIVNLEADRSSFTVNGDFGFDGLIYLCNKDELRAQWGRALDELVRLSTSGHNVATFVENQIVRLVVGGQDKTALLLELITGKERQGSATEFALGCVDFPLAQDWTINSVMHESTNGAHVGIGMGREIPHIDFIAKRPDLRFRQSPEA